jgi:hypothetical protein
MLGDIRGLPNRVVPNWKQSTEMEIEISRCSDWFDLSLRTFLSSVMIVMLYPITINIGDAFI